MKRAQGIQIHSVGEVLVFSLNCESAVARLMQPTMTGDTIAPMASLCVEEIIRPDYRRGNSIETAVVPLIAEQCRAIGKRIGSLKKVTAISWLTELALSGESSGYTVVDVIDITQEFLNVKDFAMLPLTIKNRMVQNSAIITDEMLKF